MMSELTKRIEKPFADITFKYTYEAEDDSLNLPKDFKITKYLNEDWEVDEDKLKADIKDDKLVKAILEHAEDLDIATYKLTEGFKETIPEYNKRVMTETFGEEAAKIAKEYGVYWPGIEDAIASGVIDPHKKALKLDYHGKNNAIYDLYKKYSKLPEDYYIAKKKGKWIKLAQNGIDGKKMKSPINGKTEILGKFPKWRDSFFKEPDLKKDEVRVIIGRYAYFTQSAQPNNFSLLELVNYNYVWINDEFAKERGLKFKDEVVLVNGNGKEIKAKVFPTKRIRKDCIFIATGFGSKSKMLSLGYDNGVSQAEVFENTIDPIIGSASMNETIVKIKKV